MDEDAAFAWPSKWMRVPHAAFGPPLYHAGKSLWFSPQWFYKTPPRATPAAQSAFFEALTHRSWWRRERSLFDYVLKDASGVRVWTRRPLDKELVKRFELSVRQLSA